MRGGGVKDYEFELRVLAIAHRKESITSQGVVPDVLSEKIEFGSPILKVSCSSLGTVPLSYCRGIDNEFLRKETVSHGMAEAEAVVGITGWGSASDEARKIQGQAGFIDYYKDDGRGNLSVTFGGFSKRKKGGDAEYTFPDRLIARTLVCRNVGICGTRGQPLRLSEAPWGKPVGHENECSRQSNECEWEMP